MTDYITKLLDGQPVEWRTLGEVCELITDFTAAGSFASNAKHVQYLSEPDFAQLVRTTDLKTKFATTKGNVYVSESAYQYLWRVVLDQESIILPNVGNCGEVYYVTPEDLPYQHNVLGPNALLVRSSWVSNKYLYYLLQCEPFQSDLKKITTSTGQTKFNKTNLKQLRIPIPPVRVQRRIVEILDTFSALTAELEAELEGRRKQYAYYRERLLTLPDAPRLPLGDSSIIHIANAKRKAVKASERVAGTTPYFGANNIQDYVEGFTHEGEHVLLAEDGSASLEQYSVQWAKNKFWANNHVHVLKAVGGLDGRFLYHYLKVVNFKPYLNGESRAKLTKENLAKITIPIPPLEEQRRIVEVLDRFSTLCESITEGLPREIELRRKQYEYYREQLLTFPQS